MADELVLDSGRAQATPITRLLLALRLDPPLMCGVATICAIGVLALYSAGGQSVELLWQHGLRLAVGFGVLLVIAQIPPRNLWLLTPWAYVGGLLLLAWVLVGGDVSGGAQRWLDLGFVRVQPSEFMKLAVPMMVAWYLGDRAVPPSLGRVLASLLLVAVPVALIARQPDLGTALLIASSGAFVLFLAGVTWRLITTLGVFAAAMVPIGWHFMESYQRQRVLTFFDPEADPLGSGYHIIQSKIAIGSGGLYGKGWLNGTQSHLDFLPERSTDFVFAVFGEEFGFFGGVLLLLLYLFVVGRGLYISTQAQDAFGRLLAGSLALTFFVYVVVNIGMVTGLLPVVGLPLPLVSYGGTSMVTLLAGFGIIMSVYSRKRLLAP